MVTLSVRFFGFPIKTFHLDLGVDLPEKHFKGKVGPLEAELSFGPRTVVAPAHSTQLVEVQAHEVAHEAPDPRVDPYS